MVVGVIAAAFMPIGVGLGALRAQAPAESPECAMRVERITALNGEVRDLQNRIVELARIGKEQANRVEAEKQKHRDAVQSMLAIVNQKGKSEKQRLSEVGTALLTPE